jgi:hypothetical protein
MRERMARNKGIAAKFLIIISLVILVIFIGMAISLIVTVKSSQTSLADSFVETLQAEQIEQEKQPKSGIVKKANAVATFLSRSAGGLIYNFDFPAVQDLVHSAEQDVDIEMVIFYDTDHNPITEVRGGHENFTERPAVLSPDRPAGWQRGLHLCKY